MLSPAFQLPRTGFRLILPYLSLLKNGSTPKPHYFQTALSYFKNVQQCLLELCESLQAHGNTYNCNTFCFQLRKCGRWEECKKSEFAQIYRPLAAIGQGRLGCFTGGESGWILNFQVLLFWKEKSLWRTVLFIFSEKKRKGLKCLFLFCRWILRLGLFQHRFSLFHYQSRREENLLRGYEVSLSIDLARE